MEQAGPGDVYLAAVVHERVATVLRTRRPCLRSVPGCWLVWTTVCVAVFALAAPFIAPFARLFGFVPLPAPVLATMIVVVVGYALATELAKRRF